MMKNLSSLTKSAFKSEEVQQSFFEKGYVLLDTSLSETQLELLTNFTLQNLDKYAFSTYISTIELEDVAHRKEAFSLFKKVFDPIIDEYFLNYEVHYGGLGVKYNRETTFLEAHQDTTMVPYDEERTGLTLWVPLIDVNKNNGCVQVIPKSHTYNRRPRATGCPFAYEMDEQEILSQMIEIPVKKGQILVMDQSLIHCSGANRSEFVRVAVMGMIKPKEAQLVCYYPISEQSCEKLEVYAVPIDFYSSYMLTSKPHGLIRDKIIDNSEQLYYWFDRKQ